LSALKQVAAQVVAARGASPLGTLYGHYIDQSRSAVVVMVPVASDGAKRFARQRWHGLVALDGLLTPVR
jgi:hypothetical protein